MPYNQLGFTSFFNYPHRAKQFLFRSLISDDVPVSVDFFPPSYSASSGGSRKNNWGQYRPPLMLFHPAGIKHRLNEPYLPLTRVTPPAPSQPECAAQGRLGGVSSWGGGITTVSLAAPKAGIFTHAGTPRGGNPGWLFKTSRGALQTSA